VSYRQRENSVQDGDPVFRFVFTQGVNAYAFTGEPQIVADSNYTYIPVPIRVSNISQTNELAKDPVKLEFPKTDDFASQFVGGVPEDVTTVTIFRGHVGDFDEEFLFYWKGRVAGASISGDVVRLDCENIFTSMRRPGLRARYQRRCRHALYQSGCKVVMSDYRQDIQVLSTKGNTVTLGEEPFIDSNSRMDSNDSNLDSNDSNYDSTYDSVYTPDLNISSDPDYYVGGLLRDSRGVDRYIVAQNGNVLTLVRRNDDLSQRIVDDGPEIVQLYPGCDHTRKTCVQRFNNQVNFGGFPWLPTKNPFGNDVTGSVV
jgi:hypothetical protein